MSKLHRHVAQSAQTDHANFLALGDAPVMHRRIRGDPGAEQRRGCGEIEIRRDAQDEVFIDDDAFGVAAVGPASKVLVRGVEGEDHVRAELFKASFAVWARAIRIDHAANRSEIALFEPGDCRADLGHTADDLMTGNDRVHSGHELAPLVADGMKIGVADAAEQNFDLHVAISWITTLDLSGSQRRCRTGSRVGFRVVRR